MLSICIVLEHDFGHKVPNALKKKGVLRNAA